MMTTIECRRTDADFNQWLFFRQVAGTVTDEDGETVPGMVDEPVDLITFKTEVDTAQKALDARAAMLPELAPGYVSPADLQATYSAAIQQHLDNMARERGYDGIHTAISYRDDPNPAFAAEALALFNWRSAVWTAATAMLTEVNPSSPPTIETVLGALPPFAWPEAE